MAAFFAQFKHDRTASFALAAALACLCFATVSYGWERSVKQRLGGDVVISGERGDISLGITAYLSINAEKRSHAVFSVVAASAEETDELPGREPLPVALQVIDREYPLYGEIRYGEVARRPIYAGFPKEGTHGAAISPAFASRLGIHPGEYFRIGKKRFVASAIYTSQPDTRDEEVPSLILSDRGFEALLQSGLTYITPATHQYRILLAANTDAQQWASQFNTLFNAEGWRATSWQNAMPAALVLVPRALVLGLAGVLMAFVVFRLVRRGRSRA